MDPFSRFTDYFLEVAKQGNLRRAAETLHVSASAIHRQIQMAEDSMGVELFERLPGGMRLTAAGELLFTDLRRWKKEFGYTLGLFDDLQGLKRGHVSLALVSALSEGPVMEAMASLCTHYPGITFDINIHESHTINKLVTDAEVDIGLVLEPVHSPQLQTLASCPIPIGIVTPPHHPLAQQPLVSVSQLQTYRQLLPAAPLMVHEHLLPAYQKLQPAKHQIIHCNDVRVIKSLAMAGAGVGLLSLLDAYTEVQQHSLAFTPLTDRQIKPLTLGLCVAASRQLSRAARMVIEQLGIILATHWGQAVAK